MPVAPTELTAISAASTSNNTTFNTANLTAVANRLYVIGVTASYTVAGTTLSTIAGGGLGDWTILTGDTNVVNAADNRRIAIAWATSASPGAAAAIDITWSGATTGGAWAAYEITGHKTSGPIGQVDGNVDTGATSLAMTLPSATANSAILSFCRVNVEETVSAELGWTGGENNSHASPSCTMASAFRVATDDLSCTFSWTNSTNSIGNMIEILAAADTTKAPPPMPKRTFYIWRK
jgi:hypothetical protein